SGDQGCAGRAPPTRRGVGGTMRLIDITLEDLAEAVREIVREEVSAALEREASTPGRVLSTREAAEIAGRSPETIREWIRLGRLRTLPRRGRQHARIRPEDLQAALEAPQGGGVDSDRWAQGI